jgi:hypothetical protein
MFKVYASYCYWATAIRNANDCKTKDCMQAGTRDPCVRTEPLIFTRIGIGL